MKTDPTPPVPAPGSTTVIGGRDLVRRWGVPLAVFAVGVALSFGAFNTIAARERERRRVEFERQATQIAVAARVGFDAPLEVLRSIPALFEASEDVTRAEFRAFVSDSLVRYSWIYALEWIPRVPGSERARFEAMARADGLEGYHFKQDAPSGPPVLAEPRREYFPLFYMEPPNKTALGIEETALDARRVAIERARDEGTTAVSERLTLVQDDPSVVSVIAFHPVYGRGDHPKDVAARRKSLRGLAGVVFRVQPVVAAALREVDLRTVDVVLLDADAQPGRALLYESSPGAAEAGSARATTEHVATIAGRKWKFRVSDRAGVVDASDLGWYWFGVGLLASLLAAACTYAAIAVLRLRRQVRQARRLGQYTLVEKLGEGGMGTVYRAHHALLRRPTAIKLMHPRRNNAAALARFEREVQLTSALTHPNTVTVYDYGRTEAGVFYYAMEYIDGITLQELVDVHGPQPAERVVGLLVQVAAALAEAHSIGLVHRDVKPPNLMLCARGGVYDFVKVLDFGLVKDRTDDSDPELSQASTVIGTPLYLAPEAVRGKGEVDARADVYALGAVAYFLLTGGPVFTGASIVEVCAKHLSVPPEPLSKRLGPGKAPDELDELVMRCLSKKPEERPASGRELAVLLAALPIRPWSNEQARLWWDEHAEGVEEAVLSLRQPRGRPSTGVSTVEIDPRRREASVVSAEERL